MNTSKNLTDSNATKEQELRLLHLHLEFEYFDQIKAGTKVEEFRAESPFNRRLMAPGVFSGIVLYRGYPKRGDESSILRRPWAGFRFATITHPHFKNVPTPCYAIRVN